MHAARRAHAYTIVLLKGYALTTYQPHFATAIALIVWSHRRRHSMSQVSSQGGGGACLFGGEVEDGRTASQISTLTREKPAFLLT